VDCVLEKSVGFATILLLFLLSQILPFMCFATLLVLVVVPNSPLRVLLHLLFQIHHLICVFATFVVVFVVANFLASCFVTFVVVIPNSPLCDLQLLLLPVLLLLLLHLGSSPPLH
jgi:hypothetical protein